MRYHYLPVEIILLIVDLIPYDKRSLQSFALTHSAFVRSARRRLFHTIRIEGDDTIRLLVGLVCAPDVLVHIRSLDVHPMRCTSSLVIVQNTSLVHNLAVLNLYNVDFSDLVANLAIIQDNLTEVRVTGCVNVTHLLNILPPLQKLIVTSPIQRSPTKATVQYNHLVVCPEAMSIFGEGIIVTTGPPPQIVEVRSWCPYSFVDHYHDDIPHPVYDKDRSTNLVVTLTWDYGRFLDYPPHSDAQPRVEFPELDCLECTQELHVLCDLSSMRDPDAFARLIHSLDDLERIDLYLQFQGGFALTTFRILVQELEKCLESDRYLPSLRVINVVVGTFVLSQAVDGHMCLKEAKDELEILLSVCERKVSSLDVWWDKEFLESAASPCAADVAGWKDWNHIDCDRVFRLGDV